MDIIKQIVDQRINKLIEENTSCFADISENQDRQKTAAFLLLGVASYLDIDIAEAVQYLTDGGNDGGFDAAYIAQPTDGALNVVLFQAKYTFDLEKDSNFPANAVEKSINTIKNRRCYGKYADGIEMTMGEVVLWRYDSNHRTLLPPLP
jgi:hypothetical protein